MSASCVSYLFRSVGSSVLVAASVLMLRAQAPDNSQQPTPTIRVSTRLVLVDVVVKDKSGKRINGLKAEDFVVQEKGKTQKIALFTSPAEAKVAERRNLVLAFFPIGQNSARPAVPLPFCCWMPPILRLKTRPMPASRS